MREFRNAAGNEALVGLNGVLQSWPSKAARRFATKTSSMCGIAGIFAYHYAANAIDRRELATMRDHMIARGPDGSGQWLDEDARVGLAHRRLAIIDLSDNGMQPIRSADGRYVVTFNGEIYNYRELRACLTAKGHEFRSESDTEVLLHLYADRGAEMVHDLRGMFAFAIFDTKSRVMLLARDPFGIKPLYYCDDGWTFRFASQVKALLAGGGTSRDPDPAGVVGFYLFGSVPEPFTIWRAIRCLPAGTMLRIDATGAGAPRRYHSIAAVYRERERSLRADAERTVDVREALKNSVRAHLVADVPVGAFLSAGVDSGALVGLMRDATAADIRTITLGFEEFRGSHEDETVLATEVAACYGTQHTTRIVTRREFEDDLPRILAAMDQPSIDGINTWFAAKAARELDLKVAISGLGGDELFGGYPSFCDIPRWVRASCVPSRIPFAGRAVRSLAGLWAGSVGRHPKAAGLLEYGGSYPGAYLLRRGLFMPWELPSVLDRDLVEQGMRRLAPVRLIEATLVPPPHSSFARVATLESSLYMRNQLLRDTDWASMAHSLEVRVPLVDSMLFANLAASAEIRRAGKQMLARAPSRQLPREVADRKKTGFTTPVECWMQDHMQSAKSFVEPLPARHLPWARDWSRIVAKHFLHIA